MLHRKARVKRGQTIVVHGANSGVGGILVQLAHHADLHIIGTAAPHHHDALRAAGVEPVDYNDQDLAGRVRQLAPRGVDAIFDNVGGPVMFASYRMLGPRGALVCYVIASMMKDTGSLIRPFMKALAQLAIWNTLPNGRTATFYNVWSGYGLRPSHLPQSPPRGPEASFRPSRQRHHHSQRRGPLPPRRSQRGDGPRRIAHCLRKGDPRPLAAHPGTTKKHLR